MGRRERVDFIVRPLQLCSSRVGMAAAPHGGSSSLPPPTAPLPPKVEAPSSWSWLRGKQSQPSFSPFQPSSHLRQPPCPKSGYGSQVWAERAPPPHISCFPHSGGGVLGGALCYKLHKDFSQTTIQGFLSCRVGRQRLPALPRILLWTKHLGGRGWRQGMFVASAGFRVPPPSPFLGSGS